MVTFLLGHIETTVPHLDTNTTVLEYLREHLCRTGTKEGCASGDCGACTAVVAEVVDNQLNYQSINTCIAPLMTLHGKQLITVEDLAEGYRLHPVQQAMVDCHGSQCGFCTPGFVMSIFAHCKNARSNDLEDICESLGGNLCRCTGYRPIIEAVRQLSEQSAKDHFSANEEKTMAALCSISALKTELNLCHRNHRFFAPTAASQLARLIDQYPDARLLAGGTDLYLEVTQQLRPLETQIYVGAVAELRQISTTVSHLEIGAAVTYSELQPRLVAQYPDLKELLDRLGSRQIRNRGTLGGNIGNASPIGDMPPVLIAVGASLILGNADGSREIPTEEYFLGYKKTALAPGEFIQSIRIPLPHPSQFFRTYKISKRIEDDISTTCGAFNVTLDGDTVSRVRIAFGGMAEIPKRASACEAAMMGQRWCQATINSAMAALANDFSPISDFRSSSDYRMQVSQNMLRRLFAEQQHCSGYVRVTQHA